MIGIPTLLDISPTNLSDLDERDAYQHFFGKSLAEAKELFGQGDFYVNDLGWMGEGAFKFYINAYIDYLNDCNLSELDIVLPMGLVMTGFAVHDNHDDLMVLIDKISDLRDKSLRGDAGFEREYDEVVGKIMKGRE